MYAAAAAAAVVVFIWIWNIDSENKSCHMNVSTKLMEILSNDPQFIYHIRKLDLLNMKS